jgi:DNA-binding NarL/FixJ family response regulator
LEHEIEHLARQITPSLSAAEAKGYCSSVISRARDTHLKGDEKRYRYKRETLYNQLSPLIPADLLPRLRAIIPDELAAERKRDSNRKSKAKSRAKAGAVSRSVYVGNAQEKRQKALELRAEGLSVRAIAAQLGASTRSIFGYLKEAAQCAKSVPLV